MKLDNMKTRLGWFHIARRESMKPRALIWITAVIITIGMLVSFRVSNPVHTGSYVNSEAHQSASYTYGLESMGTTTLTSAPTLSASAEQGAATMAKNSETGNLSPARMVIETATVGLKLAHPQQTATRVEQIVTSYGGFVASLQESTVNHRTTVWMTVRVPQVNFNPFLHQSRGMGRIVNFSQTGQDVTQQYNGLQQQLIELQSEAAGYTRLYQKAQTMRDMIAIQQSLSQVDAQISGITSQLHHLNRSVQLATVQLTLTPSAAVSSVKKPSPVIDAFGQSLRVLGSSAMGLVTVVAWLIPWAALFAVIAGGIKWWTRRRGRNPQA